MRELLIEPHVVATVFLSLLGGLLVGRFLLVTGRGAGCLLPLGALATAYLLFALSRGSAQLLEILTRNLAVFIDRSPLAFMSFLLGMGLASRFWTRGRGHRSAAIQTRQ